MRDIENSGCFIRFQCHKIIKLMISEVEKAMDATSTSMFIDRCAIVLLYYKICMASFTFPFTVSTSKIYFHFPPNIST